MHSLQVSATGSLSHGVRRKKLLLTAQVGPDPVSLTMKPPSSFAMTLTHGAGGSRPSWRRISYSPLELNPPVPLSNCRGASGVGASGIRHRSNTSDGLEQ